MATRTHIILPEELIEQIDKVAGQRRRSRFVEAAVREKLSREALSTALRESAGILDPADHPEWETPEKVSAWVRAQRREDREHRQRKLNQRAG